MSIPKGKLIAIGGAEDKGTDLETGEVYRSNLNFFELGILRRVVQEAGGPGARIEIITTASTIQWKWAKITATLLERSVARMLISCMYEPARIL